MQLPVGDTREKGMTELQFDAAACAAIDAYLHRLARAASNPATLNQPASTNSELSHMVRHFTDRKILPMAHATRAGVKCLASRASTNATWTQPSGQSQEQL
jgi:hypothetical protein